MTVGVYGIFDRRDGSCLYVGQSKTIAQRWRQHVTKLKNKRKSALDDFVDWYHENGASEEILDFRILEECVNDDYTKNFLEAKWTYELGPRFKGKNPSMNETWEHSDETKAAISAGLLRNRIPKPPLPLCVQCGENRIGRKGNKFCSRVCRNLSDRIEIDIDLLEKMYLDDAVSLNEICNHFQITGGTVLDRLKSRGIVGNLSKMNRQKDLIEILTKEKLNDLYWNQYFSHSDIAAQFNTSAGVIKSLIKRYEIPAKSTSEVVKHSRTLKKIS